MLLIFWLTGQPGIPTPVVMDRDGVIRFAAAGALPGEERAFQLVNACLDK